jgi:hypothetical protein
MNLPIGDNLIGAHCNRRVFFFRTSRAAECFGVPVVMRNPVPSASYFTNILWLLIVKSRHILRSPISSTAFPCEYIRLRLILNASYRRCLRVRAPFRARRAPFVEHVEALGGPFRAIALFKRTIKDDEQEVICFHWKTILVETTVKE